MAHECHTASIFLIKPLQSSNFSCGTSLCKKANLKTRACLLNGISFFRENVCTNRNRSLIFPMSLHRGRFGLPLGILFKRLRSAKQGRDKGFQNFLHKADFWVQADDQRCLMSPPHLSFSLLPPPLSHCQHHQLHNSSGPTAPGGTHVLKECLGQNFQVSILLSHLLASPAYSSDVLMQPYLSSWDELVK